MSGFDVLGFHPWLFSGCIGVVGLMVGSFLNVVIYRVPVMMQREWDLQARDILEMDEPPQGEVLNLATPSSRCPTCRHVIRPWENIPLVSWVALRGKCSCCKSSISVRYPLVELGTAVLSTLVAMRFGYGLSCLSALVLLWGCIALLFVDLDHMLLPDSIVLPGVWLGLGVGYLGLLTSLESSFLGAAAGYLSFAVPAWVYSKLTGRSGMGGGDFKLMALFGAWLGWQMLPIVFLLSTVSAAIVGIAFARLRGSQFPFGPFIIVAGLLALFFGQDMYLWYAHANGLHIGAEFFE